MGPSFSPDSSFNSSGVFAKVNCFVSTFSRVANLLASKKGSCKIMMLSEFLLMPSTLDLCLRLCRQGLRCLLTVGHSLRLPQWLPALPWLVAGASWKLDE